MSFSDVIGRVGQIESAIAQVTGSQRQTSSPAATAQSTSAASLLAETTGSSSADTDFSAVMRSLTGSTQASGSTAAAAASAGSGTTSVPTTSGPTTPARTASISQSQSNSGVNGTDVVAQAKKYLGVPYVWGGTDPQVGLDCSGLVQLVFKDLGVTVPRVTYDQAEVGTEVDTLAEAKPGDLIVTRNGDHIGIYVGNNQMLHAPKPGKDVEIREMFEKDADILTIRRVVDAPAASSTNPTEAEIAAAQRSAFEASQSASAAPRSGVGS